jgi:hypothetical protein
VLDAVQTRVDQLPGIDDLQVRRAGDATRVAHTDHRLRAFEGKAKINLDSRRPLANVALGETLRLFRIASDDRIARVGRTFAVDVRPGGEDARAWQPV